MESFRFPTLPGGVGLALQSSAHPRPGDMEAQFLLWNSLLATEESIQITSDRSTVMLLIGQCGSLCCTLRPVSCCSGEETVTCRPQTKRGQSKDVEKMQ